MNSVKLWLIIGISLRLVLMPFTMHPDLRGHYLGASFIVRQNGLLNFYDHISKLPRDHPLVLLYNDDFLVYPPLTYLFHSLWLYISSPLINWPLFDLFELDLGQAQLQPGFPYLIFLLKLPYLVIDLLCFYFGFRLVEAKHKALAMFLWAFNLPLLHSAFLMGQFDILVIFFLLLCLFLIKTNHKYLPAICIALAAGFKPFILVLLPLLPGNTFKNTLIGLFAYLLIILPYIPSPAFRMYALVAQHSDKLWFMKLPVSGSQSVPILALCIFILCWLKIYRSSILSINGWLVTPFLLLYSTIHFHPQWFSWITPLLLLIFINFRKSGPLIACIIFCYVVIVFSFESSLNFGLFNINYKIQISDQLMSMVRALLAASCVFLVGILIRDTKSLET